MHQSVFDCQAYACYLKNDEHLLKSTSGGAFFAFAESIIEQGGVVFGAAFGDDFEVHHIGAETLAELEKIQKSKYVQSRIADTYIEVRSFLDKGRIVLFSGTPCQIAGLKSFLGKDYDTLFTIDLICHGVPSNKLLKEHIKNLENIHGPLKEIQFRDKQNGWGNVSVSYQLTEGKKILKSYEDAYVYGFEHYYFLRPSCYECRYRGMKSGADITIGDYWGIKKEHPDFTNDNKGISCIIIKSDKGKQLFQKCKDKFVYIESTVQKIANYNVWVAYTPGRKKAREIFYSKWLKGERDLFSIYRQIEKERESIKIGIIGGYSSRACINFLHFYNPGIEIQWQITNATLGSVVSDRNADIDISKMAISNDYRRQSLENDINKKFINLLEKKPAPGYIIIDFLEERFPMLFLENESVITESEAYMEIKDKLTLKLSKRVPMLKLSEEHWKKNCDTFIKMIQDIFKPEQIILNRLFLSEYYGWEGAEHSFDNLSEIRLINKKLNNYYNYFIQKMSGIHVITVDNPEKVYCYKGSRFGCEPVYYNRELLCEIRDKIIEIVEEKL